MAEAKPASKAIKLVDGQVYIVERQLNFGLLSRRERENLAQLHQNLADARLYATEYEMAETEDDRLKNAKLAKKWLAQASKRIINASQTDIFGPADVAHLSAQIEQIMESLR